MKKKLFLITAIFLTAAISANATENPATQPKKFLQKQQKQQYSSPKTERGNANEIKKQHVPVEPDISSACVDGIYTIKINTKKLTGELKPHYVVNLTTNKDVMEETGARLVINAGFFDPRNHQTTSYLTKDGKLILNPNNNKNLINNKHLQPYLDKIFNRSELRVLKNSEKGNLKYDIALHNDPIPHGYELLHAIQGGPGLVPDLRLEEEFFVLTRPDGTIEQRSSSLSKYARTLVGIKNNDIYFVIATNEHPISLPEASDLMKAAGFEKAMAYDGGGSVSVDFKDDDLHIISEKNETGRKLKSFWIVTEGEKPLPEHDYFLQAPATMMKEKK